MDLSQHFLLNLAACLATVAFFGVFALTLWPGRLTFPWAIVCYAIGIIACLSPRAYFYFIYGTVRTTGLFPVPAWLMPVLLLCFGIAAIVLLLPAIPQKAAICSGAVLFLVFAPLLLYFSLLSMYLQIHRIMFFDFGWLVYAVLWFRLREFHATQGVPC